MFKVYQVGKCHALAGNEFNGSNFVSAISVEGYLGTILFSILIFGFGGKDVINFI